MPTICDIKIVGAAPGANVLGLKVFAQNNDTTTSGFIQAIDYAVKHGAKVINESFGSNNFPDTAQDAVRAADDAAFAAGVTVVVSSGDAGVTSTIGSPSTDPDVISVGATTTFRAYQQVAYGGINDPSANGQLRRQQHLRAFVWRLHTSLGSTVDLVAPGDLNWALCDAERHVTPTARTTRNDSSEPATDIELFGGTSESSPLTAAAAADVIQAYASTHHGTDPSPALVKQILMSTATDIARRPTSKAPACLNVLAAVKEAKSIDGDERHAERRFARRARTRSTSYRPRCAARARRSRVHEHRRAPFRPSISSRTLTDKVAHHSRLFLHAAEHHARRLRVLPTPGASRSGAG